MKFFPLLAAVLSLFIGQANAQSWQWGRAATADFSSSGIAGVTGQCITTDVAGNTYCAGTFNTEHVTFGTHTLTNVFTFFSESYQCGFLVKYDPFGNPIWARNLEGLTPTAISVSNNKVYLCGYFKADWVTIGGLTFPGSTTSYTCLFTLLDTSGNCTTGLRMVNSPPARPCVMRPDGMGNYYVAGAFTTKISGYGMYTIYNSDTSGITSDIFIMKLGPAGSWLKLRPAPGSGVVNDMTIDAAGNIYLIGVDSVQDLGPFGGTLGNRGAGNFFVSKYGTDGTVLWSETCAGSGVNVVNSIAADSACNVYITGYYTSASISFDTCTLTSGNPFRYNMFLVKYDSAGNVRWGRGPAIETNPDSRYMGYNVRVNDLQQVWVTGGYYTPITLGGITLPHYTSPTFVNPMFLARYDTSGAVHHATALPSVGFNLVHLTPGSNGSILVTGVLQEAQLIVGADTISNALNSNFFVAKYGHEVPVRINGSLPATGDVSLYPIPCHGHFTISSPAANGDVRIYNIAGQMVVHVPLKGSSTRIDVPHLPPGTYTCRINLGERIVTRNIVVGQ